MFRQSIYALVIISLILSSITPAAAAPIQSSSGVQNTGVQLNAPTESSIYIEPANALLLRAIPTDLPSLYDIPATLQQSVGPYRTTVTLRGNADLARLKKIGVTILASTKTTATVIADRAQLEQLAKQNFLPRQTELTARLQTASRAPLSATATSAQVLAATTVDSDNDGLNDTEEGWWCTNPNVADSDNDRVNDGDEVNALRDWVQHTRATRPASGKPFAGWPPDHAGCYDSDYDSVPDAVEVYVFGLNPNRESTARDKFDDGQKLFGLTNCPGSGGGCGYGALPCLVDWGVIFAEMPSWVKPPYDSPFVAAFPDPDVEVVPSSFVMTAKTTITTDHTTTSGEAKTYGTSETRGTGTSLADTVTWNNWQEVSVTKPTGGKTAALNPQLNRSPLAVQSNSSNMRIAASTLGVVAAFGFAACAFSFGIGCVVTGLAGVGAASLALSADLNDKMDEIQAQAKPNKCNPTCPANGVKTQPTQQGVVDNQAATTSKQDLNRGNGGTQYSQNGQGQVVVQPIYPSSYPVAPVPSTTNTSGQSWGGARTTTNTQYEEHTTSQSQQFSSAESWGTATAVDTTHAADLTFTYRISNKGTDYAREISGIAFNIYIGDDSNPIYTYYPATDIGGDGKYTNFMPNETHTYASRVVPLTLNQMKLIDTGAHIYIVVEDFSYGVDELFYQDAINSGASFAVDSGDGILHSYVLPTWGTETIQDVAKRFFPATEDASGNLLSLTVPHYATTTPTWTAHALTDTSWWNLYLNNLGDGSAAFKDTPASANSTVLIRMNSDTDRDGYSDRTELALGTNPNDPASHPTPALTAATRSVRVGNVVTTTMAFLNSGNYDAYGVEAVLYVPDSTVTINDNTIGGSARVNSASQVVLGSRVMPATTTNWRGTSKPYSAGSYSGNTDKTFTFTAANPGNIAQGTVNINWNDGAGNSGTVNFGAGYNAPLPVTIRDGLQIGFDTGTVNTGDSFTVAARLPRDTFSYTVNSSNYITPTVVVSYNDPQGNHKFVTPVEVSDLGTNLAPYASQMLPGVGVDISTNAAFNASGNNTVYLVANSPHAQSIIGGHLFVEFVNDTGTVVAEQVFTQTLQAGPTVKPVIFNTTEFSPTYQAGHDYTLLAFFTDSQGNIIDSHARLFSTFGADPQPVLNTSPAAWNIGTVTQGAQPQQTISIVNTGIMPLNVVVNSSDPKLTLSGASGIISVPPAGTTPVVATLDTTTLSGAVSMSITIRSNDPAHQTVPFSVSGTVVTTTATAAAFDIANRPLDKTVRVYGNVPQFSTVDFTHGIAPDTTTIEPCKVYAADGTTLKGVGKYCADFGGAVSTSQLFGDGSDGDLVVGIGQSISIGTLRSGLTSTALANQNVVQTGSTAFAVGQEVLLIQIQGTGAGQYEFATITQVNGSTLSLNRNLTNTYTVGGNSLAAVHRVAHYRNVTIQNGGTLTTCPWNGIDCGIMLFRASGTLDVQSGGIIRLSGGDGAYSTNNPSGGTGGGYRGGTGNADSGPPNQGQQGEGYPGLGNWAQPANGNGGGGGMQTGAPGRLYGGGGGNGTAGTPGSGGYTGQDGAGGSAVGVADLSRLFFGGGGGGGAREYANATGGGGSGGGIAVIFAKAINIAGAVNLNGGNGGSGGGGYDGGGGSGGSILIKGGNIALGSNLVNAIGGSQGQSGQGGNGRIRVEYCDTISGATNPSASTQKLTCYIAEKTDANTVRYTVPDTVTAPGQNYILQFARRFAFTGTGNQLTYTRVVSQTYSSATMDALVTNVGAGGATNLRLEIGDSVVYSATQTITQPTTINIPNFASAVNQYVIAQSSGTTVDVPMRVTIDRQADVLLTNLGMTPGAGVDLAVNPSDLVLGCPGGASCLASEGNTIPITVTVRNTGAQNAASAVVGYYAGNPQAGGRLLGNSYVATIPAGGTATANFNWNTEGFTRTQTLYAFVDPPNAIAETLENNNIVSQTLYIKTKPDLRVASITFSATDRVVGEPITATIVISNTGETTASTHYTRISERGERGDSSSQDLPTSTIAATSTVTLTTPLSPIFFGTRTITITADATNVITESVETNNVLTRTVFVGINAKNIDAGAASDTAYTTLNGYGYLNGSVYDFGGGTITKTVRYDGSGAVQYRFDGLQPSRSYHLDALFYQEGDNFTQKISFDGIDSGQTIQMVDGTASAVSLLVPPSAFADTTMIVTIQRPSGTAAPTRFRAPQSSVGPAFVSQLSLTPIEYTYLDSGGASDVAYDALRGYGYLNGFASGLGGSDAVSTYRSVFTSTLFYRFDQLNPVKNYLLDLTMYDGVSSTRAQTVTIDGAVAAGCANLAVNAIVRVQCPITPTLYSTDRTITVGVICGNCTGPRVNEIALEEKTRDVTTPIVPPTPTPTFTFTPTSTPTNTVQTTISAFAAQWSGNIVQITWSTTKESKTDQFQLYRSTTLSPGAWTVVKTQVTQSNCATSSTPYSYAFTDNNVVAGQTYHYKLAWTGDSCGGVASAGVYSTIVTATESSSNDVFLPMILRNSGVGNQPVAPRTIPTPTLSPSPTHTLTPSRSPTLVPTAPPTSSQTPPLSRSPTLTLTPTVTLTPTPSQTLTR